MQNPTAMERYELEMRNRERWKNIPYQRVLLFTWEITHKCTLKCRPCFAEAGPNKNIFIDAGRLDDVVAESVELFQGYPLTTCALIQAYEDGKTAEQLIGKTSSSIRVTGGDPFCHPDLYKIIMSFSKRKNQLGYGHLEVETNAWWATNDNKAKEIISTVKEAGADIIMMTVDYWHKENSPFPNDEYAKRAYRIGKEIGFPVHWILTSMPNFELIKEGGPSIPRVAPIGRARYLDEIYWENTFADCWYENCRLTPSPNTNLEEPLLEWFKRGCHEHTDEITLDPKGNVYLCNSGKEFEGATLAIGNIYEKGITDIIDCWQNPVVRALKERGIRALTEIVGLSIEEHYGLYDKMMPCGLCHEMLRNHGKKIMENFNRSQF